MAGERNENLLDQFNGIVGRLNTVRLASTALSSSFWGWIILGTIFSLAFITFTMDMGNQGQASVGGQEQNPQNVNQAQNINGLFSVASDANQSLILGFIQDLSSQVNLQKLISGPVTVLFGTDSKIMPLCSGIVINSTITLNNFSTSTCGTNAKRYMFLHELGHVIGNLNKRNIFNPFEQALNGSVNQSISNLMELDNKAPYSCYTATGFLKSYEGEGLGLEVNNIDESFAEGFADSIIKTRTPFNDFPTNCPATYNWFKTYILSR